MGEYNYCAYIDVLGYRAIVSDPSKSISLREDILRSIFENLAVAIVDQIKEINRRCKYQIEIRSFSDCFYLQCKDVMPILVACNGIFNWHIHYYSSFSIEEEYTSLIRCGVVYDWINRFRDIGGIIAGKELSNPVGLGIARAYEVSEKSKLSGMRIIVSPEAISGLSLEPKAVDYECYCLESKIFDYPLPLYISPVRENEDGHSTNLYELIWPDVSHCTEDDVSILKKIKSNFSPTVMRHYNKTVEVYLKAYPLSDCQKAIGNKYDEYIATLKGLIID